eukprot:1399857-Heterocapsa_arctica.AAC.1
MLPKEAGDAPTAQRPIGLLPMVYRIWAAARNPEVRRWAKSKGQDDAWGGKPGAGAMDAAFSLGVEGEAALADGQCMGAVFLDCSKCYERIPIVALYRAAVADGFPPGLARMACLQYQAPRFVRVAGAAAEAGQVTRGMVAGCGMAVALLQTYLGPLSR